MYVKSCALYIGQGAANLIEVYANKGDAQPHDLILIDFGSAGKKGGGGTVNEPGSFAARDYLKRVLDSNHGELDLLIMSHLDEDHINEVAPLKEARTLKKINKTIIGGTNSGITDTRHPFQKNSKMTAHVNRVVKRLAQAVTGICDKICIFTANDGYLDQGGNIYEVTIGDASLVLKLLANRSTPGIKGASEFINSNSSVSVVEYMDRAGHHYALIFPGDATADTFAFINKRFRDDTKRSSYSFLNASEKILILPHHGALKTACNAQTIKKNVKLSEQLAETKYFADAIQPTAVYASAHYNAKRYFHPSLSSMGLFVEHMPDIAAGHKVLGYELKLDNDFPLSTGKQFTPKYDLKTVDCTRRAYTAHTIEADIDIKFASYAARGDMHIGDFAGSTHTFGNLVCEIDAGNIDINYRPV